MASAGDVGVWRLKVRVHRLREQRRLMKHLSSVERDLRRMDVSHLGASQRAARARSLGSLRTYWLAGSFPVNTVYPGNMVPYLRDARGIRCAMAHVIEEAGDSKLVDALAAADNNVRIRDVNGGPLLSWLDGNGLKKEEAARVQPAYPHDPPPPPPSAASGGPVVVEPVGFSVAFTLGFTIAFLALQVGGMKFLNLTLREIWRTERPALAGFAVASTGMGLLAAAAATLLF